MPLTASGAHDVLTDGWVGQGWYWFGADAEPTASDFNEVSGIDRIQVVVGDWTQPTGQNSATLNKNKDSSSATQAVTGITHIGIADAASGGALKGWFRAQVPDPNDPSQLIDGSIDLGMDQQLRIPTGFVVTLELA